MSREMIPAKEIIICDRCKIHVSTSGAHNERVAMQCYWESWNHEGAGASNDSKLDLCTDCCEAFRKFMKENLP